MQWWQRVLFDVCLQRVLHISQVPPSLTIAQPSVPLKTMAAVTAQTV